MDKLKLLIIEDDVDQHDLLRETLEDYFGGITVVGATVHAAGAGCRTIGSFDLILCDYNLPDCTGMELLEAIRMRCNTPVIMVTGENVGHTAVEAIKRGATDYIVKLGDYLFTIPLIVEKNLTVAKVKRENEQLRTRLEQALAEVAIESGPVGGITPARGADGGHRSADGLIQPPHFGRVIEQLFDEAQRYEKDLSCVMIDLDGYKQLNDSYGHQVGDQLLVTAGKVISANMRRMDVAARYGGDEFVLLLPHASCVEAQTVAARIRDEYRIASGAVLGRPLGITMSVGIGSLSVSRPAAADQLVAMAGYGVVLREGCGKRSDHDRDRADDEAAEASGVAFSRTNRLSDQSTKIAT